MSEVKSGGVDWFSLIIGVIFMLTALLSFGNPAGNLVALVLVFATVAILRGILEIFLSKKLKMVTSYTFVPILMGILNIIIGLFFLFNIKAGVMALPYIFAIWFIFYSILSLFTLDLAKAISKGYYWFKLIIGVIGVVVGIMLFLDPISSALTISFLVGFYFMMFGTAYIVSAFR